MSRDTIFISTAATPEDIVTTKLAFSYGIQQSVKLTDIESLVENEVWELYTLSEIPVKEYWTLLDSTNRKVK